MEEEDFFSDDDLEDVADDTLRELERNAWSSTQKQAAASALPLREQTRHISRTNRGGNLVNNPPWRPPQRSQPPSKPVAVPTAAAPTSFDDYGLDDEVVIDLNDTSTIPQPSSHSGGKLSNSQQRQHGNVRLRHGSRPPPDTQTSAAYAAADAELAQEPVRRSLPTETNVALLQARVAQLEAEQKQLRLAAQEARNAASAKQGEIAIVRANQDKASKEYERRISTLQRQQADEVTRHRAELDSRGKEMEKMKTDNRFLQHEAAQETERAGRRHGPGKTRTAPASRESPRNSRIRTLGDGFDDNEVQNVSPSRSRDKSREGTPKLGAKRKRPVPDSPVTSLSFAPAAQSLQREGSNHSVVMVASALAEGAAQLQDETYEFMQRILNHTPSHNRVPTFEALAKCFFPSSPNQSVSASLMSGITSYLSADVDQLPWNVSCLLLKLWKRCIEEKYLTPLSLLLDLLRFILYFEASNMVIKLMEQSIPLCSRSIDLVTIDITKAAVIPNYDKQVDWTALEKLAEEVDSVEIMEFLLFLCQAASISPESIEIFWRHIEGTFLFTLLSKALPMSHITIALQMLKISALTTSFGPICSDPESQTVLEHGAVERLTNLLFEVPTPPKDEAVYTEEEVAELRIEVLQVLQHLCLTEHGGMLVASHRSALGRLIRFLDGQLCKLYEVRPSVGLLQPQDSTLTSRSTAHDLIVQTVNLATRIFYHVLRTYDSSIDIVQKMSMVQGGYHKFLVSLTRIAFSEQLVFESGIEEEVSMAAHTILDNFLSPEDSDAIAKAVETPRGTRGSTTEKDTNSDDRIDLDDEDTMMSDVG